MADAHPKLLTLRNTLLITIIWFSGSGAFAQEVNSQNFHQFIEGTWVYDGFYNENWEKKDWTCVDTNKIDSTGIILSSRYCEGRTEPITSKTQWTRFDSDSMKIYAKSFDDIFGTGWTQEYEAHRVVKFSSNEIWIESKGFTEGTSGFHTLRVIYRRIN